MWTLDGRVTDHGESIAASTPILTIVSLAIALCATALLVPSGWLPGPLLGAVALTAGHGALLATALAWTAWDDTPRWDPRPAMASVIAAIAVATLLTAAAPSVGAIGYAIPLAVYVTLGARGRLDSLGLRRPRAGRATLLGGGVGAALGAHLLLSASLMLGYKLRGDGATAYVSALAYDVGVNIASSELFCRGALLRRALGRGSLAGAVAITTGVGVLRYLVDPLLPHAPEAVAGAMLYLTLLGVANAWLVAASGSVVPALASATVFFAAYRLIIAG